MDSFLNLIKGQSAQIDQGWAQPRLAVITSVDAATATARVTIQPEGVLSGWLPVASPWVGANWGLVCLPSAGDQVVVIWQEGDAEQGVIIARLWSSATVPPPAPVGEFWLVHKAGNSLKLHNDGTIESFGSTWTHGGDLRVKGDIYDQHGSMAALRAHYNEHVHPPGETPPEPID